MIDESKRQNRIIEVYARNSARSQWLTFSLNVLVGLATLIAFVSTGDPASFAMLAVPGVSVIANVAINAKPRRKDDWELE